MLDTFHDLGVPVAENKLVGPSTCITFWGIEIDIGPDEVAVARGQVWKS